MVSSSPCVKKFRTCLPWGANTDKTDNSCVRTNEEMALPGHTWPARLCGRGVWMTFQLPFALPRGRTVPTDLCCRWPDAAEAEGPVPLPADGQTPLCDSWKEARYPEYWKQKTNGEYRNTGVMLLLLLTPRQNSRNPRV
jgi:hypothetical protein